MGTIGGKWGMNKQWSKKIASGECVTLSFAAEVTVTVVNTYHAWCSLYMVYCEHVCNAAGRCPDKIMQQKGSCHIFNIICLPCVCICKIMQDSFFGAEQFLNRIILRTVLLLNSSVKSYLRDRCTVVLGDLTVPWNREADVFLEFLMMWAC